MSTNRYRLTKTARILIFIIVLIAIGAGIFAASKCGIISLEEVSNYNPGSEVVPDEDGNVINTKKSDDSTINLSLDEWIGWKSILDANGGLSTADGSIYDKLGIKVNISIINDATQSSNALISKDLDAAGYTINRTAFLSEKFKDSGIDVIMPYITNFSNGGDGIIAKSDIKSVTDLVGKKVGVPQFSEAHTLVVWFVNNSDLTKEQKDTIIKNLVFFDTPDDAAKAFFAGEIDAAATWEPYLTQAKNMSDAHILFSTKSSSSLVMDGILFNKEFAESNPDVVAKFIDGSLQAHDMYDTEMNTIKRVMPMFSTAEDKDIKDNCASAKLTTYADNLNLFTGTAKTIYTDMCDVWISLGESVNKELVNTLFDDKYIKTLSSSYDVSDITKTDAKVEVDENDDKAVEDVVKIKALLKKSASVNFIINTAKFTDSADAKKKLDKFIDIAKVLDGTIIEIAGNTDPNPISDPDDKLNKKLSKSRAQTVKKYFVMNGIDASRIVTVGNGSSNPVVKNDTEKHKAMNRRTDVSFKSIEG